VGVIGKNRLPSLGAHQSSPAPGIVGILGVVKVRGAHAGYQEILWCKTPGASRRANLGMRSYLPQQNLSVNLFSYQRPPSPACDFIFA